MQLLRTHYNRSGESVTGVIRGRTALAGVTGATFTIALFSAISKAVGFLRDRTLAVAFGVGAESDAYLVAVWIPALMVALFMNGVRVALLPVFTEQRIKGDEAGAFRLASTVLLLAVLLSGVLVLAGCIWTPALVRLVAPGFDERTSPITAELLRIVLPGMVFAAAAAVISAVLHAHRVFGPVAAGPAILNIATISAIGALARIWGVKAAAAGFLCGQIAQLLILLPYLSGRWTPSCSLRGLNDPGLRAVLRMTGPLTVAAFFTQGSSIIEKYVASGLGSGSVAALAFANKLILLPVGLFSTAVSTAVYPSLAEAASRGDLTKLAGRVRKGVRALAYISMPAAFGLAFIRYPIVRLLFERGAFDSNATEATSAAVLWYSMGMVFLSVQPVFTRALNATKDTATTSAITVCGIIIHALAARVLSVSMGYSGLALAASIHAAFALALTAILFHRRLGAWFDWSDLGVFLARLLLCSAAMIPVVLSALKLTASLLGGRLLPVVAGVGSGVLTYFALSLLLGIEETRMVAGFVVKGLASLRYGRAFCFPRNDRST